MSVLAGSTAAVIIAYRGASGIDVQGSFTNTAGASITQTTLSQDVIHHLISLQNPYVNNNQINTLQCHPVDMTVSLQCNDPSQVYVYMDESLATGIHNFVSQGSKPIAYCGSTATFATTALPIASFVVGTTGTTTQFNLSTYRINLPPGAILSVAVFSEPLIIKYPPWSNAHSPNSTGLICGF